MSVAGDLPEGTVTVLFTDLVGSTELNQQLGDESARAIGRWVEQLVLEHIEAHRGVPIKEMGDGVMAAFASARRAVVCAREIQRAMRERGRPDPTQRVHMRIGLHTGEVLTEHGDLHGETVIIAKRVESVAPPDGVFATATVHLVLGTARNELEDRGEFSLKGIASPWRLYEVPCGDADVDAGSVLPDTRATPYTGRRGERDRLFELVSSAAAGRGSIVLISGEAGAGKTRLVGESADEARRHRMNVLTGNCLDVDVPPPYQPLLDQLEAASQQRASERLREAMGENAPELAKLMPALRQRYEDIPDPPSLPPEQERQYVLHGIEAFLGRTAMARPLLLVFEDLHWADESTLLLLEHLAPRLASMPLMIVGTYRQTDLDLNRPFSRCLASLSRARHAVEIPLQLLDREEVEVLLSARARQSAPPEGIDLIYSETDGNPFFVEEMFRHLHEAGKLFDETGQWLSGIAIGETEVPRGVQRVIGRRLERLSPETRRILATAAVIGRSFSFDLLATVGGAGDDAIFDALEQAEPLRLITEITGSRDAQYAFVHEQFRQTLLSELSLPRRQRLHVRVADAIEAETARTGHPATAAIANHLELAGSAAPGGRTADALIASGRTALDALAFEDALRVLRRSLPYLDDSAPERRAEVLALQARALRGSGLVEEALATLDRALVDLPHGGQIQARVLLQRAELLLDQFRAEPTLGDLATLVEVHRGTGDRRGELQALLALGRAQYIMSLDRREFAQPARDTYGDAFALAEALADQRAMAMALIPTSWFTDYWADYRPIALANLDRALQLATDCGDEDLIIEARSARLRVRAVAEVGDEAEALLAQLEARRDPVRLKELCFLMMWRHYARDELDRCVAICDRGIELAGQLNSAPVQYGTIKALALVEMGRFDLVEAAIAQEVTDEKHPFGQACAHLARAVYLDRIEAPDAIEGALEGYERASELSRIWMQQWYVTLLTSMAARLRHGGAAVPTSIDDVLRDTEARPSAVAQADRLLSEGRPDEALRLLAQHFEPVIGGGVRMVQKWTVEARCRLAVRSWQQAHDVARWAVDKSAQHDQASLIWQPRLIGARALDEMGARNEASAQRALAGQEFAVLVDRIDDPRLRAAFEGSWDRYV